ncbi:MAG TPA: acyltransferase [Thermoanaerobaculia bacterium]|jgi:acetyltransferase-like isoleucine patch superfamily enzyme|nr:acyltransferase [Thermoanaerobaculia bacterium]
MPEAHLAVSTRPRPLLERIRQRGLAYSARVAIDRLIQGVLGLISRLRFRLGCTFQNVEYGKKIDVYGRVIIRSPAGKVIIGDRVKLISSSWRCSGSAILPTKFRTGYPSAKIIIGDDCGMSGTSITARSKTIRIGPRTQIGPDCLFMDSDFHHVWPPKRRNDFATDEYDFDITIGENVWFGARCIVLKGVTIGDNSVIAAGSVVVKSIPANCVAAGNPARVVKQFGDDGE